MEGALGLKGGQALLAEDPVVAREHRLGGAHFSFR